MAAMPLIIPHLSFPSSPFVLGRGNTRPLFRGYEGEGGEGITSLIAGSTSGLVVRETTELTGRDKAFPWYPRATVYGVEQVHKTLLS